MAIHIIIGVSESFSEEASMKSLLNSALITLSILLGLGISACTVLVDPSSGSSATTGGSNSSAFMNRQQQTAEFAKVNFQRLKQDIAIGQGEYLSSLATLLSIEPSRQSEFFLFTQRKFTVLFPSDQTTADEMLMALNQEMRADPRFGTYLALN
ncbi:MAG TPA: DUF3015 family protein [Candidatus Competibacteraceae bacterium]|nr:DUF3015 family protein [Candidatus Competibacteraceae bacterium]